MKIISTTFVLIYAFLLSGISHGYTLSPVYSTTDDGYALTSSTVDWETCRTKTVAGTIGKTDSYYHIATLAWNNSGTYYISRSFLPFTIPDLSGKYVSGATLNIMRYDDGFGTEGVMSAQQGTFTIPITVDSIDDFSGYSFGTAAWPGTGVGGESYISFSFNGPGRAYISSVSGTTAKICLRDYEYDYLDEARPEGNGIGCGMYYADNTGTSKDPYLSIEYAYIGLDETTDDLADNRVIAYDASGQGAVDLSGAYSFGTPNHIEVSVFRRDTDTTVQVGGNDWNTVSSESISGGYDGTWSGTLSGIPTTNAALGFRIRKDNDTGNPYTSRNNIYVGYVVYLAGQSYPYFWTRYAPYTPVTIETPDDYCFMYQDSAWAVISGDAATILANKLHEELSCPIAIVNVSVGGSALLEANKAGPYGYWIGSSAADNWLEDMYEVAAITEPKSRRLSNAFIFYQGYTDGQKDVTYSAYYGGLESLISSIESNFNFENIPIFIIECPRCSDCGTTHDAGWDNMRRSQMDICDVSDTDNIYFAARTIDLPLYTDGIHMSEAAQEVEGIRAAQSILHYELNSGDYTYSRGPKASGWYIDDTEHTGVYISHRGGSTFTPTADIDSFEVYDFGSSMWRDTTGARVDPTTILLNHAASEVTGVRALYGADPPITYIVKDNTALQLPIETSSMSEVDQIVSAPSMLIMFSN